MATATVPMLGRIQEYSPENELFSSYTERVELFFAANDVADEKKVAVFLSLIGSKTYSLLRNLVSPTRPQEKSYKDLVEVLKAHYEPKHHHSGEISFPSPCSSGSRVNF